jgi:hypothetical protein
MLHFKDQTFSFQFFFMTDTFSYLFKAINYSFKSCLHLFALLLLVSYDLLPVELVPFFHEVGLFFLK